MAVKYATYEDILMQLTKNILSITICIIDLISMSMSVYPPSSNFEWIDVWPMLSGYHDAHGELWWYFDIVHKLIVNGKSKGRALPLIQSINTFPLHPVTARLSDHGIAYILIFLALRWKVPIMRPGPNWGHLALKIDFLFKCEISVLQTI